MRMYQIVEDVKDFPVEDSLEDKRMIYVTTEGEDSSTVAPANGRVRKPWERIRYAMDFQGQESKVQNAAVNQTDVNAIVERFKRDGYLPPQTKPAYYDDVVELQGDLTDLINKSTATIADMQEFARNWEPKAATPPEVPPQPVVAPAPTAPTAPQT